MVPAPPPLNQSLAAEESDGGAGGELGWSELSDRGAWWELEEVEAQGGARRVGGQRRRSSELRRAVVRLRGLRFSGCGRAEAELGAVMARGEEDSTGGDGGN
ncbi:uncharacterized protein A4U43_C03F6530 [Asparagus officinalis]|uniref:Uncharacterized protein n=1 Tax=Asparagus officinalis TaxID=4686 RepID=A0A5P1F8F4_ASPOF|nr:uncharacterized protein A4U43_C03F6530 [Asparagus officinalis]